MFEWVDLFSDLSEKEKANLAMFCQENNVYAWETLFLEHEVASSMYILKSWIIEISRELDWRTVIIWEIINKWILWEMGLFWEPHNRMATAKVISDAKLIVVLDFSMKELTAKHPNLLNKIQNIIKERKTINSKI